MPAEWRTTYMNEVGGAGPGVSRLEPVAQSQQVGGPRKWQPSLFITIAVPTHGKQPDADREYVQMNCVPTAKKGRWEERSEVGGLDGERLPERRESEFGFY